MGVGVRGGIRVEHAQVRVGIVMLSPGPISIEHIRGACWHFIVVVVVLQALLALVDAFENWSLFIHAIRSFIILVGLRVRKRLVVEFKLLPCEV